jgi:hypothetical protein
VGVKEDIDSNWHPRSPYQTRRRLCVHTHGPVPWVQEEHLSKFLPHGGSVRRPSRLWVVHSGFVPNIFVVFSAGRHSGYSLVDVATEPLGWLLHRIISIRRLRIATSLLYCWSRTHRRRRGGGVPGGVRGNPSTTFQKFCPNSRSVVTCEGMSDATRGSTSVSDIYEEYRLHR